MNEQQDGIGLFVILLTNQANHTKLDSEFSLNISLFSSTSIGNMPPLTIPSFFVALPSYHKQGFGSATFYPAEPYNLGRVKL